MAVGERARGFTIIEMVTVIATIGILAAMLFPVFARSREQARTVVCANNLSEIGLALQMYAEEWGGRYPPQEDNLAPIARRMGGDASFRCPSARYSGLTKKDLERLGKARHTEYLEPRAARPASYHDQYTPVIADGVLLGCDYYYRAGLTNEVPGDTVLAAEREASHSDRGHVLYASGRVKLLPAAEWKKVIPAGAQRREGDYASEQEPGGMPSWRRGGMRGGAVGRGGRR